MLRSFAGDGPAGLLLLEEALALRRTLLEGEPGSANLMRLITTSLDAIGDQCGDADLARAAAAYDESVALSRELLGRTPKSAGAFRDLALGLARAGYARTVLQDRGGALARLNEARAIYVRLAAKIPRLQGELDWILGLIADAEALPAE